MIAQPAAAANAGTVAGTGPGAGAGADSTGSSCAGSTNGDAFAQTLQALAAVAAGTPLASQAGDPLPGQAAGEASTTNPPAGEAALLDATRTPDTALGAPDARPTGASNSGNSAPQEANAGGTRASMAKDLLRLLLAKPLSALAADGAAPRAGTATAEEKDSGASNDGDAAPTASAAAPDSSTVATLLTQLPNPTPLPVTAKWNDSDAAKAVDERAAAPMRAPNAVATAKGAALVVEPHATALPTLARLGDAATAASTLAPQGSLADTPHPPRVVATSDTSIDTSGMAAALRAASAANTSPVEHTVSVPVHDRHWPTALAAQVLILGGDKVSAATLRLTPEHLGPVEVRIDMQDSNVNVNFTAAHAETRSALEQAMPQLRSVLAGAGLTLGQATVQQQARQGSQNPQSALRGVAGVDEVHEAPAALWRALGIVDEYA